MGDCCGLATIASNPIAGVGLGKKIAGVMWSSACYSTHSNCNTIMEFELEDHVCYGF